MANDPPEIVRAARDWADAHRYVHPLDATCDTLGRFVSRASGLKRAGLSVMRLAPGKASFPLHAHQCEEEWVYILEGAATALIGDAAYTVGAGDFVAYPAGGAPHSLRNDGAADVVYLMGGENLAADIVDFPVLGRRMTRVGDKIDLTDHAAIVLYDLMAGMKPK